MKKVLFVASEAVPFIKTGGLKDTVENYNADEQNGTGFSFSNYDAQEMLDTVRRAVNVYYDQKQEWEGIAERAMKEDFSWNSSARQYEYIYNNL